MAKNRPQNRSQHPTGPSPSPLQTETKENPDKPLDDQPDVVTKEDEHDEAPQLPVETKDAAQTAQDDPETPSGDQDTPDDQTSASSAHSTAQDGTERSAASSSPTESPSTTKTTSGASSESDDFYYRNGVRIIRPGGKVTFRGETINNAIFVQEEVVQESQSSSSRRPTHRLLYFKGQRLTIDQASKIAQ